MHACICDYTYAYLHTHALADAFSRNADVYFRAHVKLESSAIFHNAFVLLHDIVHTSLMYSFCALKNNAVADLREIHTLHSYKLYPLIHHAVADLCDKASEQSSAGSYMRRVRELEYADVLKRLDQRYSGACVCLRISPLSYVHTCV